MTNSLCVHIISGITFYAHLSSSSQYSTNSSAHVPLGYTTTVIQASESNRLSLPICSCDSPSNRSPSQQTINVVAMEIVGVPFSSGGLVPVIHIAKCNMFFNSFTEPYHFGEFCSFE